MRIGSLGKGEIPAMGLLYAACEVRSWITPPARHTHDGGSEPTHTYVSCVAKVIEAADTDNYSHTINSTRRAGSTPLLIGREVRHTTAPQILSHTTID